MASFSVNRPSCPPALIAASSRNPARVSDLVRVTFGLPLAPRMGPKLLCGPSWAGPNFQVSASLNSAAATDLEPMVISPKDKKEFHIPDAPSIAAFMNQVADLIELVDSRDIVELQLKQMGCEILIRKKDALQPPPVAAPAFVHQPSPQPMLPLLPVAAPPPSSKAVSAPSPAPAALPPKPNALSHPPLKCPMAGTFYRSPAPGAPPFVKVGDKVQKGQAICIIEAMKLMNEIEADQAGTVVEILVDDGKPVSVDTPLFIIAP